MSIVTKTGDKGTTGLFGGKRIPKNSPRIEAYGTVDELNAVIGMVRSDKSLPSTSSDQLLQIQHLLFRVGGDLATPLDTPSKQHRMSAEHTKQMEEWISNLENALPPQQAFLLPGGTSAGAHLHLARTVCRRAERRVVTLERTETINPQVRIFLNRLSDYLFVAARKATIAGGAEEVEVEY